MKTHERHTPEYYAWVNMRSRCFTKTCRDYKWYGARGVSVSKEWDVFEAFIQDMGPKPSPKHSLERIDNEKGYSADNCKWATAEEQANNQRVRSTNKSGVQGVFKRRDGYWIAKFKGEYIGCFSSFDKAYAARKAAEIDHASIGS